MTLKGRCGLGLRGAVLHHWSDPGGRSAADRAVSSRIVALSFDLDDSGDDGEHVANAVRSNIVFLVQQSVSGATILQVQSNMHNVLIGF